MVVSDNFDTFVVAACAYVEADIDLGSVRRDYSVKD